MSWIARIPAVLSTIAAVSLLSAAAVADTFPTRPIKIVVPFPAGGAADTMTRVVTAEAAKDLGQPIIVDNKPGASGRIATRAVKEAAADGYTLAYFSQTNAVVAAGDPTVPYDIFKDFVPISILADFYGVVLVHPGLGINSMKDLVAYAKANPGKLAYGSFGQGSVNHLFTERLALEAGIKVNHIPYRGEAPVLQDLLSGQIQFAVSALPPQQALSGGTLKLIATTGPERWFIAPDTPTLVEQGFPDLINITWNGFAVPTGTPQPVIDRLYTALVKAVQVPEVKEKLASFGFIPRGTPPEALSQALRRDYDRSRQIIKDADIKLD